MGKIDVQRRWLGVCYENGRASVLVWAPKVKDMAIHLYDSKKTVELTSKEFGYWQADIETFAGEKYKYIADGKELPDPASLSQPEGVHGPAAIMDTSCFVWNDKSWVNPALEDYIFYEVHTGTFTTEGTFKAIEAKLEHLVACGITAIEIMPVAQFPGGRNWGYDGVFPFAVQDTYGGPYQLQQLVDKCHEKSIAVVLDVVYNHLGPEGNYLDAYGHYFTDKYKTPWGDAINVDDAGCDEVRRFFIENALMWLRDFHIDALRLDAVHAIKDLGAKHFLQELKEHVDELMEYTGRTYYLIAECDLNDSKYIAPLAAHGYGIDAQWTDEFHHALRVASGNEQKGYYSDFNGLPHLAKAYKDAYVYDGIYSPHRQKTFGNKAIADGKHFVVFSQNHDQVGNRMLGERTSKLLSFEMQKLVAGAVMVSPYLPLLFMGEEWGSPQPFMYFISHTDDELVAAVREGRKAEFASFHGGGETPDPQAEETFNNSKLQWELLEQEPHKTLFRYYKALINLRKIDPVLCSLNRRNMNVKVYEARQVLVLHRWTDKNEVICFMNFSKEVQQVTTPELTVKFEKIFDSADMEWGGNVLSETSTHAVPCIVQPESLIIYATENI